jgi:hypothetical protein
LQEHQLNFKAFLLLRHIGLGRFNHHFVPASLQRQAPPSCNFGIRHITLFLQFTFAFKLTALRSTFLYISIGFSLLRWHFIWHTYCHVCTVICFLTDSVKDDIPIHKHRIFAPLLTFYMALTVPLRTVRFFLYKMQQRRAKILCLCIGLSTLWTLSVLKY